LWRASEGGKGVLCSLSPTIRQVSCFPRGNLNQPQQRRAAEVNNITEYKMQVSEEGGPALGCAGGRLLLRSLWQREDPERPGLSSEELTDSRKPAALGNCVRCGTLVTPNKKQPASDCEGRDFSGEERQAKAFPYWISVGDFGVLVLGVGQGLSAKAMFELTFNWYLLVLLAAGAGALTRLVRDLGRREFPGANTVTAITVAVFVFPRKWLGCGRLFFRIFAFNSKRSRYPSPDWRFFTVFFIYCLGADLLLLSVGGEHFGAA
jgi:hypothetical protein